MTKEELIKFLKDNLKIKTSTEESWETKEISISIFWEMKKYQPIIFLN